MALGTATREALRIALANAGLGTELADIIDRIADVAAADLAKIDGITNGTGAAGKALVLSAGGDLTVPEASDLTLGTTTGSKIGTATTQKLGFWNVTPVVQPTALTAQLTTITPADAAGTPDYAIAAVINTNAYGFASAEEAITALYVIKNLQVRLAEVEAKLEALGLVAAN